MFTRIQSFNESGESKIKDNQLRFNKLPVIFNRYDTVQSRLELSDDTDHTIDRENFENQYYQYEAKFNEIYIL